MAEGLVARRSTSLLPKGVRYYERDPDPGRRIPGKGFRIGRGDPEVGQRVPAEGDVHRKKRRSMEYVPRVPAEDLESQELAYPHEHVRCKSKALMSIQ